MIRLIIVITLVSLVPLSAGSCNTGIIDNQATVGHTSFSPLGEPGIAYFAQTFIALEGLAREFTFEIKPMFGYEHLTDDTEFRVLLTETNNDAYPGLQPTNVVFESEDIVLPIEGLGNQI